MDFYNKFFIPLVACIILTLTCVGINDILHSKNVMNKRLPEVYIVGSVIFGAMTFFLFIAWLSLLL